MKDKKNALMDLLMITDDPMDVFGIFSEPSLNYFIQDIERIVRTSREYRAWLYVMKTKNGQSIDSFTGYNTYDYQLSLEIHHVIYLYDIVYITGLEMLSRLDEEDSYSTFQIADQVIRDHFKGIIPIVPMLKSFHEMYHEGLKQFKQEDIFGQYQVWLDKYSEFISEYKLKDFKDKLLINSTKSIT